MRIMRMGTPGDDIPAFPATSERHPAPVSSAQNESAA